VADQERKEDAEEQDKDAEEGSAKRASSEADPKTGSKARAKREEVSDEDDAPAEGEAGSTATEEDEDDEAAKRVARALGLEDGEEGQGSEAGAKATDAKEPEPVANRSARRREDALERRKKRKGGAAPKTESEEEILPKDKNARAKELLKRRREQAAGPRSIQLLPGEMVDDALARSTSAAGKWIRQNFNKLQWVILAALVGTGAFLLYTSQTEKKAAAATSSLFAGVSSELGHVMPEDKRPDEEKEVDPTKVFKTAEERSEAALAGYRKTIAEHPGTIVAQLAKLGEAGVLLDKHDWPGALEAYSAVIASKLASTDLDVKGRATEGLGLAKEGKGDLDGALAAFKELEGIDARGYKELGLYQQGRIQLAKGDTDKAKELLQQAREKLQALGAAAGSFLYLQGEIDETLRQIDPSLVPTTNLAAPGGSKGGSMSADDRQKIQKMLEDAAKKKPAEER
jgi:tetratricopeptide (TPR) repeat protein